MIELLLLLIGILLAATIATSIEYYRQIQKAQKEYEKAKEVVEEVVFSFNRELKRESDKVELVAYKVEGSASKADTSLKRAEIVEKKIEPIESQLNTISGDNLKTLSKISDLSRKMNEIESANAALKSKITELEEKAKKLYEVPEIRSEPVIPIRRDKAMAALTNTEVRVLEILSAEGSKTAPEIKDGIQLSREHTARLMKKLYEKGYLERETGRIPFRYKIKKEMAKILRKAENQ